MEQREASAAVPVVEAMGDTACGDSGTRQAFVGAGRKLVARVQGRPNRKHVPKEDFATGSTRRTLVPTPRRLDAPPAVA